MAGKVEHQQLRVFCPTHKINFEVPGARRILCESGGHALAHDFPHENFWEYCCDCQVFWPSEMDKGGKAKEHCPVCTRHTARRYVCEECKLVSLESDDPAKRKAFKISKTGSIDPTCPACGSQPAASSPEHYCEDTAATFCTTRRSCPFCDEQLSKDAGVLFCPYCGKNAKQTDRFCKHCGQLMASKGARSSTSPTRARKKTQLSPVTPSPTLLDSPVLPPIQHDRLRCRSDALDDTRDDNLTVVAPSPMPGSAKLLWIAAILIVVFGLFIAFGLLTMKNSVPSNRSAIPVASKSIVPEEPRQTPELRPEVFYEQGVTNVRAGRYIEAITDYQQAIALKSDYGEAYHELGYAFYRLGKNEDSIEASNKAISIRPKSAATYRNLGLAYGALSRWVEAVKSFQEAAVLEPNATTQYRLGGAFKNAEDSESAVTAYREAIRLKPDYAAAHYELGVLYLEAGEQSLALEEYTTLDSLDQKLAVKLYTKIQE